MSELHSQQTAREMLHTAAERLAMAVTKAVLAAQNIRFWRVVLSWSRRVAQLIPPLTAELLPR